MASEDEPATFEDGALTTPGKDEAKLPTNPEAWDNSAAKSPTNPEATPQNDAVPSPTNAPRNQKTPKRRKGPSLKGTGLHRAPSGLYIWRRPDDGTGYRPKRSTESHDLEEAKRIAKKFHSEYLLEKNGMAPPADPWAIQLKPLVEEWEKYQGKELEVGASTIRTRKMRVLRALEELNLRTGADLDHILDIDERLKAIGDERSFTRTRLRRAYQTPLKQFSKWLAGNKRHLDRDPLAQWTPIRLKRSERSTEKCHRGFEPEEVARALIAQDWLDEFYGRKACLRTLFTTLLITGARPGSIIERDVSHFDRKKSLIDLGLDMGNKRRGAGALDPKTAAEIGVYLGERKEGPMFAHPDYDGRLNLEFIIRSWRRAFGLGVLDAIWPKSESRDPRLAFLVGNALQKATGKGIGKALNLGKGGNPKRLRPKMKKAHAELGAQVPRIFERLQEEWNARMARVTAYGLKTTHISWALDKGVPRILIEKQVGHCKVGESELAELARLLNGNPIQRQHYTDLTLDIFDASMSAKAVRERLDGANIGASLFLKESKKEEREAG